MQSINSAIVNEPENDMMIERRIPNSLRDKRRGLIILLAMQLTLLGGCSDPTAAEMSVSSGGASGISVPAAIKRATITAPGTLNAYLYCGVNSQPVAMTIEDDFASGSCTNLLLSQTHTVRVEFEFTSTEFGGSYLIATASKVGVSASQTSSSVSFTPEDFDTSSDQDGDQISNLDELTNGTDPGRPLCILGQSTIGQCIL